MATSTTQFITIPRPGRGDTVILPRGGNTVYTFPFSPAELILETQGKSLLLEFPDGGTVAVPDFFDHAPEALPALRLPDGEIVSALVFLERYEPEILDRYLAELGSGVGEYEDDPGNLLNGIDRLGMLPPIYWSVERLEPITSEYDEYAEGPSIPGCGIDVGVETPWGEGFASAVFEDDLPYKYLDPHNQPRALVPGRIMFDFSPDEGTTVTDIRLWNFNEGTVLFLGNPNEGGVIIEPDADGIYHFSLEDLTETGVYLLPPPYSDEDMLVSYEVDLVAEGGSATLSGDFPIVVDAVADKPDSVVVDAQTAFIDGSLVVTDEDAQETFTDGWAEKELTKGEGHTDDSSVLVRVPVTLEARFYDLDGSEEHSLYLEVPEGGGWTLLVNGRAAEVVTDLPGYEGRAFFRIPVTNQSINGDGSVSVDAVLVNNDPGHLREQDTVLDLALVAVAEEVHLSGEELITENNRAVTEGSTQVRLDSVSSGLVVRMGWASESADGTKYGGGYDPTLTVADYAAATDGGRYALIAMSLIAPTASGETALGETITQVTFTYDPALGTLVDAAGNAIPGMAGPGALVTVTLTGPPYISADGQSLVTGSVKFEPAPGFSADDLDSALRYVVTVTSESGASAEFSGTGSIVIDAVADRPDTGAMDTEYGAAEDGVAYVATTPGSLVPVTGSASFSDLDGSELLYVVVSIPDVDWSVNGLANNQLLSRSDLIALWRDAGGMPGAGSDAAVDAALANALTAGLSGNSRQYLLIQYDPASGSFTVFARDASGSVGEVSVDGLELSYQGGTITYSVPVRTGSNEIDASLTIESQAVSLERDPGDREYDYSNNISGGEVTQTEVEVIALQGRLQVSFACFEDGKPYQNLLAEGADPATGPRDETYQDGYDPVIGYPISMALVGGEEGEYVHSITIASLPDAAEGVIFYQGRAVTAGQVIDNPDLTAFSFRPAENFSGNVAFNFSYVVASSVTGPAELPFTGSANLAVDSVADLAQATSEGGGRADGGSEISTFAYVVQDDGWVVQDAPYQQWIRIAFTVKATFSDLDGSERAWLDIKLPEGYDIPDDLDYQLVIIDGERYARVAVPDLTTLQSTDGYVEIPVQLRRRPDTNQSYLEIHVKTQETDSLNSDGHSTGNNLSDRVITQDITAEVFDGAFELKVGWVYEGSKSGGTATADLSTIGIDPDTTTPYGAPITFEVTNGVLVGLTILFAPQYGTLYLNGVAQTPVDGYYVFSDAQLQSGQITFVPSQQYSDMDVPFLYRATVIDRVGHTFEIGGDSLFIVDAVADAAAVNNNVVGVTDDNVSVNLSVNAAFRDVDGSERHYILVEALPGWTCLSPHTVITIYFDAGGNVLTPTGVDAAGNYTYTLPPGSTSQQYFRVDVTDQSIAADGAAADYTVTMQPPAGGGDTTLSVGTLAEEAYDNLDGYERDIANNQAWRFGETTVNVVDATLSVSATPAFEDHNPNQHTGGSGVSTDGIITLTLSDSGEVIHTAAGQNIVLTFSYAGPGDPGSFTYGGVTYTFGQSGNYVQLPNGTYQLTLPASSLANGSTSFSLRYNPPADDDTDLTGLNFSVPVIATGSGYTGTLSADLNRLIVDAVADKPTGLAASPDYGSGVGGSLSAVPGGDTVDVAIQARFGDYTDDSENHYLVIDLGAFSGLDLSSLPAGYTWMVLNAAQVQAAGLTNYTNTGRYAVIQVPNAYLRDTGGLFRGTVTLTAPDVTQDTSYTLNYVAVAVETPTDTEARTDNNYSETPGSVAIQVNAVTSIPLINAQIAYENDMRLEHIGNTTAQGGAPLGVSGIDAGEALTAVTFTFAADAGRIWLNTAPVNGPVVVGTIDLGNGRTLTCDLSGGNYVITITSNQGTDLSSLVNAMTFVPESNYLDTDVPITISGTVTDTASGESVDFGPQQTTVIVDAVAQKPEDADSDVTYDPGFIAASDVVNLTLSAAFRDFDGSEQHYLLVQVKGYFDNPGYPTITLGFDANGNPLTPKPGGGYLNPNPGSGTDQSVSASYTRQFYLIEVDTIINQYNPNGPATQTIGDFTVTLKDDGSYSVTLDLTLDVNASAVSRDIVNDTLVTGAMSRETATVGGNNGTGGQEGYQYNNSAFDLTETTVSIALVQTVSVSAIFGTASEQNSPEANLGIYGTGNGAGILILRETPDAGNYDNEQITVTFTFNALYQDGSGQWVLPGTIWYNGAEVPYEVDPATGLVTVTVTLNTDDANSIINAADVAGDTETRDTQIDGSILRFVPSGETYNEADINLTYTTSVKDLASGATEANTGTGSGTVIIDAVADKPEISDVQWTYANAGQYVASATPEVTLSFTVEFPDTGTPDGGGTRVSEGQYILIERITDMDLTEDFKSAIVQAGYSLEPFSLNNVIYYRIPITFFSEDPVGSGQFQVTLPLTVVGMDIADISDFNSPNILALAIVEQTHGQEVVFSNNAAQTEVPVPDLNFAVVTTTIAGGQSYVYEGDTPGAWEGNYDPNFGVIFKLGINFGPSLGGQSEEAVGGVVFDYDDSRGQLSYLDGDGNWVNVADGGSVPAEYCNNLRFIPFDTNSPDDDLDVPIGYSLTVRDPASGATETLTGTYLIVVDAVAEQPQDLVVEDILYGGAADGYLTYDQDVDISVSVTFPDWQKTGDHATHYILIQKPGEGWTCDYPGTLSYTGDDGTIYFAIPVNLADFTDTSGRVKFTVTLHTPSGGTLLYEDASPLKVGAVTIDRRDGIPAGDRELTYDNNIATAEGKEIEFRLEEEEYNYLVVDPMYENNNPDGYLVDDNGDPVQGSGGGKVHLADTIQVPDGQGGYTTEDVEYVQLYWDTSIADLYVNGQLVQPGDIIPASEFGNVVFQVKNEYSDVDLGTVTANVHTTQGNDYGSSDYVPVDAVATAPTNVGATPSYEEDGYSAAPAGEDVTLNVSATFHDVDGSEDLFLMVKAEPGWDNPMGYDIINGPDGEPYYRIPVDRSELGPDGSVTKEITLTPPADGQGAVVGENGQLIYDLTVGAMTVENLDRTSSDAGNRGDEVLESNNTSFNLTGTVTVVTSIAESNPILHMGNTYANNDLDGDGTSDPSAAANIWITGLDTASDRMPQVTLTYNNSHGDVEYKDLDIGSYPDVTKTVDASGNVTLVIRNPEIINALLAGSESDSAVKYVSGDYNDQDVSLTGSMVVEDLFSSDSKTVSNGDTIIVDAVARQPENIIVEVTDPNFNGAVQSDSVVPIAVTATFPDIDDPTAANAHHYLIIEQLDGWELDGPLPTGVQIIVGDDGNTYFRIDVDQYGGGGSPALVQNQDGSYTFSLDLRSPVFTQDVTDATTIKAGAVTIVDDSDLELTFDNNANQITQDVPISVGVVETTEVVWNIDTITENDAAGAAITLSPATQAALASNNEKITESTFTLSGDFTVYPTGSQVGTIIYDGVAYPVISNGDGTASTTVDFGAAGYDPDPSNEFRLVWGTVSTDGAGNVNYDGSGNPIVTDWNHTGSNMGVSTGSTVVDNFSNDTQTGVTGDSSLAWDPTANPPTDITVTDPTDVFPGGADVTFTVSANFVDVDGSEDHYILVEQQSGWTGSYSTTTVNGVTYFMVPVSSTEPNPTATITLTAPDDFDQDGSVTLAVGGMSVDGGSTAYTFDGDSVNIDIAVVSADGVSLTMAQMAEDEFTQMTFALEGGDNESITAITITDLAGGSIVDGAGNVLFASAPASLDLATALAGGYYYQAPAYGSGDFSVGFDATVTDNASGAAKTFSQTGAVTVTPVTNVPLDPDGNASDLVVGEDEATVTVTLSATFEDNDGSESHFFLVTLPDGAVPPAGWSVVTDATLLAAAGLTGQTVYRVEADASGSASFTLSLEPGFGGDDLTFLAGAVENATLSGTPDYQFSAQETVTLPDVPVIDPAGLDMSLLGDEADILAAALAEAEDEQMPPPGRAQLFGATSEATAQDTLDPAPTSDPAFHSNPENADPTVTDVSQEQEAAYLELATVDLDGFIPQPEPELDLEAAAELVAVEAPPQTAGPDLNVIFHDLRSEAVIDGPEEASMANVAEDADLPAIWSGVKGEPVEQEALPYKTGIPDGKNAVSQPMPDVPEAVDPFLSCPELARPGQEESPEEALIQVISQTGC